MRHCVHTVPGLVCLLALVLAGCTSSQLNIARNHYYGRNAPAAVKALVPLPEGETDHVLYLMERGMMRQAAGDYAGSAADWTEATEWIRKLDVYSLSKGAASFVVNDRTLAFRGAPYERALLHAFAAMSYFAMADWSGAAVEARILVDGLKDLNGFPDDPFSHYVAGLAFELFGNADSAAIEYGAASALRPDLAIDPRTGRFVQTEADSNGTTIPEIVCLIGIGSAQTMTGNRGTFYRWGEAPYAEILADEKELGRSHALSTTRDLHEATQRRMLALKTAKTAARIVIKDTIADAVAHENSFLGQALGALLFAAEMPDTRAWETLPMFLHVARLPCPQDLKEITVHIRNERGALLKTVTVNSSLTRKHGTSIAIIRAF